MNTKRIAFTALVAFVSAFMAVALFHFLGWNQQKVSFIEKTPVQLASYQMPQGNNQPVDFRFAAAASTPTVVHIKCTIKPQRPVYQHQDPFRGFFGNDFFQFFNSPNPYQAQPKVSTGSGVIVSEDGYVITNNHVIQNADEIEVVLNNNKTYKARLVGKDADTDIALIKIDDGSLPYIRFANSDSVMVGEWVLAVGNPFNLSSTVTAGIVSAKGRNINLHNNEMTRGGSTAIESFIQTDAAVNPGNSGGALVNMNGELVGINTAIASPTGSYAGYSFAVPSNIVRKVLFDLKEFGVTQRGFLGVNIRTMDSETAKELGFDAPYGVYVDGVNKGSAADEAGLQNKDVIVKINSYPVNSSPELQEQVAQYRPGDPIKVEYIRNGKPYTTTVILKNKYNTLAAVDNSKDILNELGVKVENLTDIEKRSLGIQNGVKITDIRPGKLTESTDIRKGFVITQIDDQSVNNVEDLINLLKLKTGRVLVEGIYPNKPMSYLYAFRM